MIRSATAAVGIALSLSAATSGGQVPGRPGIPRLGDNHPDMQGVWDHATLTPLERPEEFRDRPTVTAQEARDFERRTLERTDQDQRRGSTAADVAVGYNEFWSERGNGLAELDGRKLTSRVIDPPSGRLPPLTVDAQRRVTEEAEQMRRGPADNPEERGLTERCMTPNPLVGVTPEANYLQIVQTPTHIVIAFEKMHETRIIRVTDRPHLNPSLRLRMGDSIGRWDGDTLIVDTTNYRGPFMFSPVSDGLHLIERFSLADANTLRYEYTVDDPATFAATWTAILPMKRTDSRMFEFACHEGNYALQHILSGARDQERRGAR